MIFYNSQLMSSSELANLCMVNVSKLPENFEEHQTALYFHLNKLIERSQEEGDCPEQLLEEFLQVYYPLAVTPQALTSFLMEQDAMVQLLTQLQNDWRNYDPSLSENSILYGGMNTKQAVEAYSKITFRSYLETLISHTT